jgi:hypothetical protein
MTHNMPLMKRAGIGVFRHLQGDPPFQEIPIPVASAAAHQMTGQGEAAQGTGSDSCLVFALQEPTYVAGIRFTYTFTNGAKDLLGLNLFWKKSDQPDFPAAPNFFELVPPTGPKPRTSFVWIDDVIDKACIRLHQDQNPTGFEIEEFVLLVPETGPPATPDRPRRPGPRASDTGGPAGGKR